MASLWQGIAQSITSSIAQIIAKKVAAWAVEKALAVAGIGAKAADAGAGAASAMASIPYVGPVLALAAMASVFGAVSGMKSSVPTASAAGGYDIPGTVNPIVQAHAREMILPARYADVIRGMADGGQAQAATPIHIHGQPDDSIKLRDLPRVLRGLQRDFVWNPR